MRFGASVRRARAGLPRPLRDALEVALDAARDFREDRALRLAAALSYYSLFSLGPLLVISVAVAGLVFGAEAARADIVAEVRALAGSAAAEATDALLASAAASPASGRAGLVLGAVALLVGASGVFGQLQDALDTVWEVRRRKGRGWRGFVRDRFLSFVTVLGTGFLLLVSLVLSAALAAAGRWTGSALPGGVALWRVANEAFAFAVVAAVFALVYKVVPDARVRWRHAIPGAVAASVMFLAGKVLLGLYLGRGAAASTVAAAGAIVVIMVWVWWSCIALFVGAELAQAIARRHGGGIEPRPNAERVTGEERRQQGLRT